MEPWQEQTNALRSIDQAALVCADRRIGDDAVGRARSRSSSLGSSLMTRTSFKREPLRITDEKGKPIKYSIIAKGGYTAPREVE